MKSRYSTKFFPFSPGIPWTIKNGKYVVPKIDRQVWERVLTGRDISVVAHGGLLESLFSLSYFEALASFDAKHDMFWIGNPSYYSLVQSQGLAKVSPYDFSQKTVKKYPVPLFLDDSGGAFFNCLNNYPTARSWYGKHPIRRKEPILQQLFDNSLVEWNSEFIPKLRRLPARCHEEWLRRGPGPARNARYVLVCPESIGGSKRISTALWWSYKQVLELAAMLSRFRLPVVVFTSREELFYNCHNLYCAPADDLTLLCHLIRDAWMILARDLDVVFASMLLSDAMIMALHQYGPCDLQRNAEFIEAENVISTERGELRPIDIHAICESLL
jgi:hypothetical protein